MELNKTIPENIMDYNSMCVLVKNLEELEFNYIGYNITQTFDCNLHFKHSTSCYNLKVYHSNETLSNDIFFSLYLNDSTDEIVEFRISISDLIIETDRNVTNIPILYEKLILPFVKEYHVYREHYKRLNLKILNTSLRRSLECINMNKIYKECEGLDKILLDKDNLIVYNIEDNMTHELDINNNEWMTYLN